MCLKKVLKIVFILFLNIQFSLGKTQITIGAIFENDYEGEVAFRYAIDRENVHGRDIEFVPEIKQVENLDSTTSERIACELMAMGVGAIFGPTNPEAQGIVSSIADTFEIPHIVTFWSMLEQPQYHLNHYFTLNTYPETNMLSRAFADLIEDYDWKTFTIIYEDDAGLIRLQDVLQIHNPWDSPITVRQLGDDPDYRPLLKEIQMSGESHIILDCSVDKITDILRQAKDVKMMEEYQSYVITSLDAHTIDFDELKFSRSNITALRIIDPKSFEVKNAVHDWEQGEKRHGRTFRMSPENVKTYPALIHDSVRVLTNAMREIHAETPIEMTPMQCKQNKVNWEFGRPIVNYMKTKLDQGITGPMIFDTAGRRTHCYMDIIESSKEGFKKIGTWDPIHGVNYTRTAGEVESQIFESLQSKTFIVSSRIGPPFLMMREPKDGEVYEGNRRYVGYSIDLIDQISKILNFTYKFELVPDGNYGSYNKQTKKWNGLVKHLLDRKADLAICDLTITYERRTAVDFTMPFLTLGISILYSKPVVQPPNLFSFLSPLSLDVWIYMGTAYLGVSLLLFVLARMAPDDWENPHPCNQDPDEVENIWDMKNCTWLTMGSIMGQGCDILPKAISTRLVAGMWWFFALIMLASYTANLAAFLTMERMDASIESAEDLAKQSKIKYGAVLGGSTLSFFKNSNFSTYQRMWAAMESARPSVFAKSNDEGIERVVKGKRGYAFLMESTSIEYNIERDCSLTQIGGLLDSKGYGIAMPVNSPYRTAISGAVLRLQEEGKLSQLKTAWWSGGGKCKKDAEASSDSAAELGIGNVGGVFVVLAFGCLVAFLIGVMEFLWNIRKIAVDEKMTPSEALIRELKFALNIWITTKPVHTSSSDDNSSKHSSKSSRRTSKSVDTTSALKSIKGNNAVVKDS